MKTQLLVQLLASTTLVTGLSARPEGRPTPPEPESVVAEMIGDYDLDENNSLSETELVAAFIGIREAHQAERQAKRRQMTSTDETTDESVKSPRAGKRRGPPPPEDMATRIIEDFDTNGDAELDSAELFEAITFLHSQPRPRHGPRPTEET